MAQKILLAVDGSERGFEAVSIVGKLVKDHPDLHLILFHCVPHVSGLLPGELCAGLEPSCVLAPADQVRLGKAIFEESRRRLLAIGFPENNIEFKLKAGSADAAEDIQIQADNEEAGTIAVGRRGLNQLQTLLLGSVSNKEAQYAQHQPVWIVDSPAYESPRVLVAIGGSYDAAGLYRYLAEFVAPIPKLEYTFMHFISPVPPTLWDDGHILSPAEQQARQEWVERWRSESKQKMEKLMAEGRDLLVQKGVPERNVTLIIQPTKQGIARDLLNEIEAHQFQLVIMGKRSSPEKKPFLMGSHANKILQNLKKAILCLVDSQGTAEK